MTTSKVVVKKAPAVSSTGIADKTDLLFETSWEVCNKVGGIYAVLSTKARSLVEQFGDKLIFIGRDFGEASDIYFKERKTILRQASSKLSLPWGISIRAGRWNIPGSPQVVLVSPGETSAHMSEIYGDMWREYGVDSLHGYGDYGESCEFAVASAIVIQALIRHMKATPAKVIAHFDEWTTGMGLLYLKSHEPAVSTIFTTHATSIGRSICGNGKPLYDYFHQYNGDQMAEQLNMQSKHSLEKAAAHNADCFTTVSEVTARECEQLLQIRPQVVTPNGFEPDFVPRTVKYNRLRKDGRERLLAVAKAVTGREFPADTFMIATSGRHEYRNKGLDMYLDVMARLEAHMPAGQSVLAFVLVPGWVREPSGAVVTNLDFNGTVKSDPDFLTHRLNNEDSDEVCVRIRQLEAAGSFRNMKVIYVPSYLDGHDGVVNIGYYDLLPALDLTIFPSYYEPWGYTPLESVAFGVPTITDDKAGFGQWVLDNFTNGIANCGVEVVNRTDSNYPEACQIISQQALNYMTGDSNMLLKARNLAFLTAAKADWKFFIRYYDKAMEIAMERNNRK
ncbi:MAG: glycogen/starch synthase [Bacteroidales bacterium]|nr:glycogen/starch synthase [Bacteroidales bacterium]